MEGRPLKRRTKSGGCDIPDQMHRCSFITNFGCEFNFSWPVNFLIDYVVLKSLASGTEVRRGQATSDNSKKKKKCRNPV